jgi:ubiquinone/menaquinone biosynthesis C-methylase UbiE
MHGTELQLNDLPTHSRWVQDFFRGVTHVYRKDRDNVLREYASDKWAHLLTQLRSLERPSLRDADRMFLGDETVVACYQDRLYRTRTLDAHAKYCEVLIDAIKPYCDGQLVDLGAGYGSVVLRLAADEALRSCRILALDLTDEAVACMDLLAQSERCDVRLGNCDLQNLDLRGFSIEENAVFVTSWALAYVDDLETMVAEISRLRPKVVLHFEPIYEHWSALTILDSLRRRYCEANDYNSTLLCDLRGYESQGRIRIIDERTNLVGENALAPVSLVAWTPAGSGSEARRTRGVRQGS